MANSGPSGRQSAGRGAFDAQPEAPETAAFGGVRSQRAAQRSVAPKSVAAGAAAAAGAPWSGQPTVPGVAAMAEPETSAKTSSRSSRRLSDAVTRLSDDFEKLRHTIEVHQPAQNVVFLSSGELLSDPIASQAYLYLTRNEVEAALAAQLLTGLEGATGQGLHRDQLWEIHDKMHRFRGHECGVERAEAYIRIDRAGTAQPGLKGLGLVERLPASQ